MNGIADHAGRSRAHTKQAGCLPVYQMVPELLRNPDIGEYHTYAIRYASPGHEEILHDISVDPGIVRRIVSLMNRHGVSPVHLPDIVEDMLP